MNVLKTTGMMVATLTLMGCKPSDPVYPTDHSLELSQGEVLLSNDLALVYNEDMVQGRAQDPDLSNLNVAMGVQKVLPSFLETAARREWQRLPEFFVPEQAEQIAKFIPLVEDVVPRVEALLNLLEDDLQGKIPHTSLEGMIEAARPFVANLEVRMVDADHAILDIPASEAAAPGEDPLPLRRVDGEWRIEIPEFPTALQIDQYLATAQFMLSGILGQVDDILGRVERGEITKDQAKQELMAFQQQFMALLKQFAPSGAAGEGQPEVDPNVAANFPEIVQWFEDRNNMLRTSQIDAYPELFIPEFREYAANEIQITAQLQEIINLVERVDPELGSRTRQLLIENQLPTLTSVRVIDENTLETNYRMADVQYALTFRKIDGEWLAAQNTGIPSSYMELFNRKAESVKKELAEIHQQLENGAITAEDAIRAAVVCLTQTGQPD